MEEYGTIRRSQLEGVKGELIELAIFDYAADQMHFKGMGTRVLSSGLLLERTFQSLHANILEGKDRPQMMISLPEQCVEYVSCGVGLRTSHKEDFHSYEWRGKVEQVLKRRCALKADDVAALIYSREEFLMDPQLTNEQRERLPANSTHVLIQWFASAGPKSTLTPQRFVTNLAGGNNNTKDLTGDQIRAQAKEIEAYNDIYCVVADQHG